MDHQESDVAAKESLGRVARVAFSYQRPLIDRTVGPDARGDAVIDELKTIGASAQWVAVTMPAAIQAATPDHLLALIEYHRATRPETPLPATLQRRIGTAWRGAAAEP